MNKNDSLFSADEVKTLRKQNQIKKIPEKLSGRWEHDEAFIEMLHKMNTNKVFGYVFKRVYRRGGIYYSIEPSNDYGSDKRVSTADIEYIREFFINAGWEVSYNGFDLRKSLRGLYIKGMK